LERYFGDQIATTFLALDVLSVELMRQPDATGHIVIYNGIEAPVGLPYRHALGVKSYLRGKNIPLKQFEIIIGNSCEIFSVDVWLLPPGATPPPQKCTFETTQERSTSPGKFDQYLFDHEHPDGTLYEDPFLRLQVFAEELRKDQDSVGYIIGYAARHERGEGRFVGDEYIERRYQVWDKPGTGRRLALRERKVLAERSGVDASRIIAIDGGYRASQIIELWILPSGSPKPAATPTIHRSRSN
jgi:hypothetical protein